MLRHPENRFIKYIEQKVFLSNWLSQGSIEQDYLSKNVQNFIFLRMFNKIIYLPNVSVQWAKGPTTYDLLFLIIINSPKNDIKDPSKMKN